MPFRKKGGGGQTRHIGFHWKTVKNKHGGKKKIGPSHLLGSLVKNVKIYTKIRKSGAAPLNICHIWAQSSHAEAGGQQRSAFLGGTNSPGHKSGRAG